MQATDFYEDEEDGTSIPFLQKAEDGKIYVRDYRMMTATED